MCPIAVWIKIGCRSHATHNHSKRHFPGLGGSENSTDF